MGVAQNAMMGDERERKGSWAPGSYICHCMQCKDLFIGDKRAMMCADCAYSPHKPT